MHTRMIGQTTMSEIPLRDKQLADIYCNYCSMYLGQGSPAMAANPECLEPDCEGGRHLGNPSPEVRAQVHSGRPSRHGTSVGHARPAHPESPPRRGCVAWHQPGTGTHRVLPRRVRNPRRHAGDCHAASRQSRGLTMAKTTGTRLHRSGECRCPSHDVLLTHVERRRAHRCARRAARMEAADREQH